MRMAAIYARVSSDQQREEGTIASQTAALIECAKARDLEVPSEWIFEDAGYSGATLERPGLERVRDLAAEGQIQAVLIHSPDRLSRKYAYQILLIEELDRHGVEALFLKAPQGTSAEDQLLVQFQGMIAEYERAQILERSRRGKRHRARAGEVSVLSGAPYGYRYVCKTLERPGLERVRDLAAEGQIQAVLIHSPDRLSRKYAYQILLIEELDRHGVEALFLKAPQGTSAEDQLLVQFQGMIAEYERAQILERSRRGKRHRARAGEVSVLSGAPYGYRYVCKSDDAPAAYVAIDAEARVVREVYDLYTVAGQSIGAITRHLNEQGVATRKPGARGSKVSLRASPGLVGSVRPSGRCCATLPIEAARALAKRTWPPASA